MMVRKPFGHPRHPEHTISASENRQRCPHNPHAVGFGMFLELLQQLPLWDLWDHHTELSDVGARAERWNYIGVI